MKSSDMNGKLIECQSFVGMKDDANDQNGAAYVEFVNATSLRSGKYVMLGGFPCRVKETSTAKPGKHGHSKTTVIGHGIFDGKRRETIFRDTAPSPIVKRYADIPCEAQSPTMMKTLQEVHSSMPGILSIPADDDTESRQSSESVKVEGEAKPFALVTLIVSCGHYKVTAIRFVDKAKVVDFLAKDEKEGAKAAASDSSAPVLSKKDARKQKKLLKKKQKAAATAEKAEATAE